MSVNPQLDTLETSGLIRLVTIHPELEYLFRHWLVQEAAYESLLKQERRILHHLVGEALEALYPDRRAEIAPELALHFEQAGEAERAVPYLIEAGRHALARHANQEARAFFDRADASLPKEGDGPELLRRRVEVRLGRVKAGWSFTPGDRDPTSLEGVLPVAEQLGDQRLLVEVYLWIGLLRQFRGEQYATSPGLRRALDQAVAIGEAVGDASIQAMPLAIIGMSQIFGGAFRAGAASLERAVPLLERRRDFIGASFAMDTLTLAYGWLGDFTRARAAGERAADLAEGGDPIARLDALIVQAWVESMRGNLEASIGLARQCVSQSEELGATACIVPSSFMLGDAYLQLGRPELAQPALERGNLIAASLGVARFSRPLIEGWLSSTSAELGDLAKAREGWEGALQKARAAGDRLAEAGILLQRGKTLARQADPDWAPILADLEASIQLFEALETRPFLARALREHGLALQASGETEQGREKLDRAAQLFEAMELWPEAKALRESLAKSAVGDVR